MFFFESAKHGGWQTACRYTRTALFVSHYLLNPDSQAGKHRRRRADHGILAPCGLANAIMHLVPGAAQGARGAWQKVEAGVSLQV